MAKRDEGCLVINNFVLNVFFVFKYLNKIMDD